MTYRFDHQWESERARLATLEAVFDPWSRRSILATEPRPEWHCLEVGAGAGSMAEWLCGVVGPRGSVVATDLETKFLEALDLPNLEVRRHDIVSDPLEEEAFDLIHSRAVLDHIPERDAVVQRLLAALRPGGWLALDAGDFSSVRAVGLPAEESSFFDSGFAKVIEASQAAGFDSQYGRRLGSVFREVGLSSVENEGIVFEWDSTHPMAQLYSLTFERLRAPVLEGGVLTAEAFDRLVGMMTAPGFHGISNTLFVARGQRIEA